MSDKSKTECEAIVVDSTNSIVSLKISVPKRGGAEVIPLKAKLGKTLARALAGKRGRRGLKKGDEVIVNLPTGIQKDPKAVSGMVVRMKDG